MKICRVCKIEKELSEFNKATRNKDNLNNMCSLCGKEYAKKYREDNREKYLNGQNLYYQNNKDKKLKYYEDNIKKKKEYAKKYRKENKDEINKVIRISKNKRYHNDPTYKLRELVRGRINTSLKSKGYSKKSRTYEILGCSYEEFKIHIESQWEDWMNWNNHGNPKDGILELNKSWDLDHIIPISSAKTEEDVIKLNHHSNIQPLCSYNNRIIKRGLLL